MTDKYILVVDDEPKMRRVLEVMLQKLGYRVTCASGGREALQCIEAESPDLIITDLWMPEMDGIGLLSRLREQGSVTPVIVITAHSTVETAVDAMKQGASDYLQRPFNMDALELAIQRIWTIAALTQENRYLREQLNRGFEDFIGTGPTMTHVYELIRQVAPTKTAVMISGETGTGKELAARAIHNASPRRENLFVPLNCAAIPADLLEGELFGFDKGAFTGAVNARVGKFELANGGTLFLDEITEMPPSLQAKMLRVLQEFTIERIGSNHSIPLDIRIISATNRNPREAVRSGKLREDLFYRLNVFSIEMPPLSIHTEDIPALVQHFIVKHAIRSDTVPDITPQALFLLQQYRWPGNIRELENMVERALILSNNSTLDTKHFPLEGEPLQQHHNVEDSIVKPVGSLNPAVAALEARMIAEALSRTGDNKAKAAVLLDISERALWYKLKKYSLV